MVARSDEQRQLLMLGATSASAQDEVQCGKMRELSSSKRERATCS
jgi:hypothetical protein